MEPTTTVPKLQFDGWHLLGAYPDNQPNDVGSWLLHNNGEAMLLEVPPGLFFSDITNVVRKLRCHLKYITASHDHLDHLDPEIWDLLGRDHPESKVIHPYKVLGEMQFTLGGEIGYLCRAPKHSVSDVITIFRGVAHTGDIELGTLESVNNEVPLRLKKESMAWARMFCNRNHYHVHTTVSAHLNDVRRNVDWLSLFQYK